MIIVTDKETNNAVFGRCNTEAEAIDLIDSLIDEDYENEPDKTCSELLDWYEVLITEGEEHNETLIERRTPYLNEYNEISIF